MLVPETGSLLAALAACVDLAKVKVEIVGKPAAPLFLKACAALNIAPAQALMIGDNPATDVAGAQALGMAALRVDAAFDFRDESFASLPERETGTPGRSDVVAFRR
jgi:4-nitrophenyl phosphatase